MDREGQHDNYKDLISPGLEGFLEVGELGGGYSLIKPLRVIIEVTEAGEGENYYARLDPDFGLWGSGEDVESCVDDLSNEIIALYEGGVESVMENEDVDRLRSYLTDFIARPYFISGVGDGEN